MSSEISNITLEEELNSVLEKFNNFIAKKALS